MVENSQLVELLNTFSIASITLFVYMTIVFVFATILKRNDIADIAWGFGFILLSVLTLFLSDITLEKIIITALVILWGLRLTAHVFFRNWAKAEDPSYKEWRNEWGKYFVIRSYLQIFILQGAFLFTIALPIMVANTLASDGLGLFDVIGTVVWLIGFFFESIGDYQLLRFIRKEENRGRVMTEGLWRYTRHPNYFGEVVMWWGIYLIALSAPFGWISIIGPLTITFLIYFVSGIPVLEKRYEGDLMYEGYKQRTNKFFPWFPKEPSQNGEV